MIPASRQPVFEAFFYRIVKRSIRRRFHGVFVSGLEHLESLDPGRSVVACANHTNWWDGFVIELLRPRFAGREFFLAQEERHLRRYRFLTWVGVFGIDLDGASLPGLRYALKVLRCSSSVVWMFPEGAVRRPGSQIEIKRGALWLARRSDAQILPVVIRYEWLIESKPSVLVNIGPPLKSDITPESLASRMGALYSALDACSEPGSTVPLPPSLFAPRMSMNKILDWWRSLLSGRLRQFDPQNR